MSEKAHARNKKSIPPPTNGEEEDNENDEQKQEVVQEVVNLLTVFDTSKIKSQLYRDEHQVARLGLSALDLIATTSAVFVQSLAAQAAAAASLSTNDDDDSNEAGTANVVTLPMIQQVIESNPAFAFLQQAISEIRNTDYNNIKPFVSAAALKKRPAASGTSSKSSSSRNVKPKKAAAKLPNTNGESSLEEALAVANASDAPATTMREEIVEDEDDYD
jgi:hypothetical protein